MNFANVMLHAMTTAQCSASLHTAYFSDTWHFIQATWLLTLSQQAMLTQRRSSQCNNLCWERSMAQLNTSKRHKQHDGMQMCRELSHEHQVTGLPEHRCSLAPGTSEPRRGCTPSCCLPHTPGPQLASAVPPCTHHSPLHSIILT